MEGDVQRVGVEGRRWQGSSNIPSLASVEEGLGVDVELQKWINVMNFRRRGFYKITGP